MKFWEILKFAVYHTWEEILKTIVLTKANNILSNNEAVANNFNNNFEFIPPKNVPNTSLNIYI